MKEKYDAIILGGGLAGLSCADELLRKSKRKFKILLLEKNSYLGGLAATFKKNDFLFDLAPHRWFTKNDELNKWIDELMKKEMIWVKKNTPMYQDGKFYDYPIKIFDVLKKVGPLKSSIMLITYLGARVSNRIFKKKIISMKDAYVNRFGYALYKWFNEEYNNKLWGENGTEKMSADWVEQRTKDLSFVSAIKNALGIQSNIISLTPRFRFPKKGIGAIAKNLKKRIEKNKGKIIMNVEITRLIKRKDDYRIITNSGNFTTKNIVSSIPLDELILLFNLKFPPLSYIHQKIVALFFNKPKLTNFTWVYVHPKQIRFFRFLETNNWSKAMSPKGKNSVIFEYPYQRGDEIEKFTDKELIKLTINDFIEYFSPQTKRSDVIDGKVFHVNKAYPKYDLNYTVVLNKIKTYLETNLNNLQIIGRNGMFRYNNMDHSIYTGILAAKNILAGKTVYNLEDVNNEAEYLEEK